MNEAIITRHVENLRAEIELLRTELAAFVPPGALSAGEIPALCGTCKELLCVPGLPGCARCVKVDAERLRVEQATVFAALRDALGTSPATLGQAAAQAVKAIAERDTAREKAAADLEAHSKALMNDGISKVMEDDVEGFSTVRFASTVSYAAKYLRGEADAS